MLEDYILFVKLFAFLLFARWIGEKLSGNTFLMITAILVLGYYIFMARWSIFGVLIVGFLLLMLTGIAGFMQDIIFQYGEVSRGEMEEMAASYPFQMRRW